ncbi:hypothetical protein [Nostoc sp. ChiQUE01b]|uniref:hypothetical protein n=1 Tax=Nostoc sp. ChiQUE01b TaxID=3075376 RepID=UPI002AD3C472|nr:hypothetical protein [Nostoc sp. ChiQUE01b]MDZ8262804.1 hypothetical protein [Nostoc sp. ChiQUE01b]
MILWNLNLNDLLEQGCTLANNYLRTNSSITSEIRSLCKIPEIAPKLLIEQGRDLARQGNLEGAIAKFQEARKLGQTFDFDSKDEAKRLSDASTQLETGLEAAKYGKLKEAAYAFKAAIAQDLAFGNSGIEPDQEAKRLYALNLVGTSQRLAEGLKVAKLGNLVKATETFQKAIAQDPAFNSKVKRDKEIDRLKKAAEDFQKEIKQVPTLNSKVERNIKIKGLYDNSNLKKLIQDYQRTNPKKIIQYYQQAKKLYLPIEFSTQTWDFLCNDDTTKGQYAKACSQIK